MTDDKPLSRSERTSEQRQIVSSNVRRFRRKKGFSQKKLARLAQVNRTHLARFESQATNISLDVLFSISAALEVDVRRLFEPTDDEQDW